jgi:hypothetical protein
MKGNIMNEQDNGTPEVPTGDTDTPPPTETIPNGFPDGWHVDGTGFKRIYSANTVQTLDAQEFAKYTTSLLESHRKLVHEQIMGDDHRLTEFWEKAQELADNAGHCSVYDEIAEALGGPARERDYDVTVTYSATYTVSARDPESAIDFATEMIEDAYTIGDLNVENTYVEEA